MVSLAIVDKLRPMAARVKTLTFDNIKEFAANAHIDEQLQSTTYFARPFASEEIKMIQNRLNNRPRKRLGFKTPAEVFHELLKRVAFLTRIRIIIRTFFRE